MDRAATFVREVHLEEDKSLSIYQLEEGESGCVLWDAGLVLLKYLFTPKGRLQVIGKNVLELGAGTGAVGIAAKVAGAAKVVITDVPKVIPLLQQNIRHNLEAIASDGFDVTQCQKECNQNSCAYKNLKDNFEIGASVLHWGNNDDILEACSLLATDSSSVKLSGKPFCVLVADCIYYKEGIISLVDTMVTLINQFKDKVQILCSFERRDTGNKEELLELFFGLLSQTHKLNVDYVPQCDMDEVYRSEDISIIQITG